MLDTRYPTRRSVVDPCTWNHVIATSPLVWSPIRRKPSIRRIQPSNIPWLLFLSSSDATKVSDLNTPFQNSPRDQKCVDQHVTDGNIKVWFRGDLVLPAPW